MTAQRWVVRTSQQLDAVVHEIAQLRCDPPLQIVVSPYKAKRSLDANAYLWGPLYSAIKSHIHETTGQLYSGDDLHEFFKRRLLPSKIVKVGKHFTTVTTSSASLTVAEFAEFTSKIEAYFVEELGGTLQLIHYRRIIE